MKKTNFQFYKFPLSSKHNIVYVVVLGAINKHTVSSIQKFYTSLQQQDSIVILDLEEVHYIDSTGLGVLANFQQQCEEADVQLKMCRVSQKIHHLFKMLGMTSCFAIFDSEKDVFAALKNDEVLCESVEYYLQRVEQLKAQKKEEIEVLEVVKPEVSKQSTVQSESANDAFIKIIYNSCLRVKKEHVIEISMTDCLGCKWQVVPHVKGCIVQPPFFYLNDNCKKIYFSVVPMAKNANTFLNVDVFAEQHQRISRPIRITKLLSDKTMMEYATRLMN